MMAQTPIVKLVIDDVPIPKTTPIYNLHLKLVRNPDKRCLVKAFRNLILRTMVDHLGGYNMS